MFLDQCPQSLQGSVSIRDIVGGQPFVELPQDAPYHRTLRHAERKHIPFDVDEDVIRIGACLLARSVIDWFRPDGQV